MIRTLIADELRLLTFQPVSSAIHTHWKSFLAFGLFFTWFAGVGRYWDNPKAEPWQLMGLGSLAYVFSLALVIWALLAPLRPKNWSYRNVLLFITLTSPPAILYAIPVDQFMTRDAAATVNAWFLAIVASWRVALLVNFLRRTAGLSPGLVIVATLLPLALIVTALSLLNLEHAVFEIMAGIRPQEPTANDTAYLVVLLLSLFSYMASPILLMAYLISIYRVWRGAQQGAPADAPASRPRG
jgi:hypothetical protein